MIDIFDSIIDSSMTINGDIECSGRVVLEGCVNGTFSGDQLLIGKSGHLEGRITADSIECFGRIAGNVFTRSLDLKRSGRHSGTVETAELKVELGAVLDCAIQSGANQPSMGVSLPNGEKKERK